MCIKRVGRLKQLSGFLQSFFNKIALLNAYQYPGVHLQDICLIWKFDVLFQMQSFSSLKKTPSALVL